MQERLIITMASRAMTSVYGSLAMREELRRTRSFMGTIVPPFWNTGTCKGGRVEGDIWCKVHTFDVHVHVLRRERWRDEMWRS